MIKGGIQTKPFIVVETRPEIIKMASIVHEYERRKIDLFLLHTGQHYSGNMSNNIFRDVELRDPDVNLNIGSGSHSEQTANALLGIEKELKKQNQNVFPSMINQVLERKPPMSSKHPYGNRNTSKKIVDILQECLD